MPKFQLSGEQVDIVKMHAIHQDWRALVEFIEDLVEKSKGVANGATDSPAKAKSA